MREEEEGVIGDGTCYLEKLWQKLWQKRWKPNRPISQF